MNISFIGIDKSEKDELKKKFPNAQFVEEINDIQNKNKVDALSTFIHTRISKKELENLPALKYIITQSTGYDHIDIAACKKRDIKVYNIPDYGTESVAEYTMLLMLALLRKFKPSEAILQHNINIENIERLRGNELNGKILGIAGAGRIGAYVIRIAHAFGMRIIVYNKSAIPELGKKYNVEFVSFDNLLKESDIISLHLPLTKDTYHIIDKKAISKIKKGAFIINTARGGLIDIVALADAIEKNRIAGAALDVIEAEELIAHENDILKKEISAESVKQAFIGNMLLQKDNVIITSHVAYNTEEATRRITEKTIATIKELEKGKTDLYNRII